MRPLSQLRGFAWLAMLLLLGGCIVLTVDPRAVVSGPGGSARVATLSCDDAVARVVAGEGDAKAQNALDGSAFRLLDWNVHKQGDPGWEKDLAEFAAIADIVLLQEAVL